MTVGGGVTSGTHYPYDVRSRESRPHPEGSGEVDRSLLPSDFPSESTQSGDWRGVPVVVLGGTMSETLRFSVSRGRYPLSLQLGPEVRSRRVGVGVVGVVDQREVGGRAGVEGDGGSGT